MKKIAPLLKHLKGYKNRIALYFLTSLLAVVFSLFSFSMLAPVLQVLFDDSKEPSSNKVIEFATNLVRTLEKEEGPLTALTYSILAVILFTILKNFFVYSSLNILNPIRNAVIRKLRNEMFLKALSLPIGFFNEERKGDLISKMTNDINEVEISIMNVLETFIREPLTIIITLSAMLIISPQLTLFLFILLPVSGLIIGRIGKSLKKPSGEAQEQLGNVLGVIDETLVGMRVVKAFNAEKHQLSRFTKINNLIFRLKNKIAMKRDLSSPLSETMGIIVVCIILWYGGKLIFSGQSSLTGPFFIMFIGLFYQIINPIKNLSTAFYNVQKGSAAVARMEQFLNTENTIKELPEAKTISGFDHSIELRNVHFSYGSKKILNGINLTIEKGTMVALVGSSGAGKSTLADLIPRFHDVTEGEVLIDGINIKDYKLFDLRKLMGIVNQDPILFNDTIFNNIALGTGSATAEQVEEAAKVANAHTFIMQKADKYETGVGDRGARLSGGERQRVTIARAVLKNPPILILDEATSSLDTESERIVQDAINTLMQNRTSIVIAHRLSTVQHADKIIVLDKGNIVEQGTHTELMAKGGLYKNLVDMQQVK
ncbi:MAG: ABC transporter ATP-binding protein [Chitinophagaceae bacterium]|nr:ABC transporter ATP-binding protein [Chitinophagaceae bacterium]MCB9045403.1 ABC transporter ATP-binding protein [Chitinophagales bacterium]